MSNATKIVALRNIEHTITVTCLAIGIPVILAVAYFAFGLVSELDVDKKIAKSDLVLTWHAGEGRALTAPTLQQRASAQAILESWRSDSPEKRCTAAADLVAGKALIGRSRLELIENLGSAASAMSVPPNQVAYDISGMAPNRWLIIKLANEQVVDAYIKGRSTKYPNN